MPLDTIKYKQTYNKIDDDIANDFYLPTMANSVCYDRMSGYFGSTVFIIAWDALKTFVANGGRMRLICSPVLSDDDINAILKGEKAHSDDILKEALRQELDNIWKDKKLRKPFQVLAALISQNIIEIKIAYGNAHPSFKQLFHDKVGIFYDGDNSIAFRGSVNETYKGLSNTGNLESISVFTSWNNESDAERVLHDANLFKRLWNNNAPGVVVTTLPPDIKNYITKNCPETSWEELVDEISIDVQTVTKWSANINGSRLPRNHQLTALENWVSNNHRGILEHATGSGKTYTSLCAIRRGIQDGKSILILVPSIDLLKQWRDEVNTTFADLHPHIMLCGENYRIWKKKGKLSFMTSPMTDTPKITIATMDTAVMKDFLNNISQGNHLFIVADEVHRLGSPNRRKFFDIISGYKLGVSATPKRYGDPIGTNAILNYFGGIVKPIYSLQDAITDEVLTPYFYCPVTVSLNTDEQQEWNEVTKQIKERYARLKTSENNNIDSDTQLKFLLLRRARIIKKANGKPYLALDILRKYYKPGQKWIVYCEDKTQLHNVVSLLLSNLPDADIREYYSEMAGDRDETLKAFSLFGGIVVSIKCLDEGVDIPSTTHAIILASSKNPREFIQRRGRVLRRYPGKNYSWLYDAIVIPDDSDSDRVISDKIICGELARAIQFANWSDTPTGTTHLRMVAAKYNININDISKYSVEDE